MKRPLALGLAAALPLLTACYPDEEEFQEETISIACEYYMACYSGDEYAYFSFESQSDCEAFYSAIMNAYGDYYDGCEYDKKAAKECLDAYDSITCDDYDYDDYDDDDYDYDDSACEDVYTC